MTALFDRPWLPPHLADADGLLGVGGDLSPSTLLLAYSEGVFPWFGPNDPVVWWSPDPRAVFELDRLHVSRRLARTVRQGRSTITINQCFETVMRACGENRPNGTWVTESMIEGYTRLHGLGHAHSLEVWQDGELAGGLYGVTIGGLFAAESMFHRKRDASKVALVHLVERLKARGFSLLDTQMLTPLTRTLGAVEISRIAYLNRLRMAVQQTDVRFD